ncbi:uncharacterized protein KGF55_005107 [Candida pseudojiufengensis]|uniref:uncharacterized protein n=1 Tax=Candida pseudojiufengensis TaxID=497109 RepID=UPI002224240C|nr:uncharacterized protein KGF55_005107 [Candida pseudojiufengensis]KAI5959875.1 hypothetical protein KGF55_005107 [Candida pseudojiufengensis]
MFSTIRCFATSSNSINHYQLLELPINASLKEIKLQFKKLSKKYHPDLNQHLSEDEKISNTEKFAKMVEAYDTLKDIKRKRQYDQTLRGSPNGNGSRRSNEYNRYYGEAKYYSKNGTTYTTASGLNTKRHKVKYATNDYQTTQSKFSGQHINHDKFDVPHFDYDKHLNRNLKHEQRILDKYLDENLKKKILNQLTKSGKINISEELKTKHLLRHVNQIKENDHYELGPKIKSQKKTVNNYPNVKYGGSTNYRGAATYSNLYQKPVNDDDNPFIKVFAALGAGTSLYILYKIIN